MAEAAGVEAACVIEIFGEFGIEADFEVSAGQGGGPGVAEEMLEGGLNNGAVVDEFGPVVLEFFEGPDLGVLGLRSVGGDGGRRF